MNRSKNPYSEFLIDETSGIEVPDIRHKIWAEGYKASKEDRQVIKSIIKTPNGMVLVFDGKGEQIPEYQGQYEKVKSRILSNAPPSAEFSYAFDNETEIKAVPREEW